MSNFFPFKLFFLSTLILGVSFSSAQAASLFYQPPKEPIGLNQEFRVDILLDTEGETVNAVAGSLIVPENVLKLEAISEGNSFLSFWMEKPQLEAGKISFAGIAPGGFSGNRGLLFSLFFSAPQELAASLEWRELQVLAHDGQGTALAVTTPPLALKIEDLPLASDTPLSVVDGDLPEEFSLYLSRDPLIFDNRWFIAFATQDKIAGLDYFEVREEQLLRGQEEAGEWQRAESPYLLKDQNLTSRVMVRAVDRAGNERLASLEPVNQDIIAQADYWFWPLRFGALIFFIFVVLILFICFRRILRK